MGGSLENHQLVIAKSLEYGHTTKIQVTLTHYYLCHQMQGNLEIKDNSQYQCSKRKIQKSLVKNELVLQ